MQLMPATAKGLGVNPKKMDDNIRGGVMYLKEMLDLTGGDVRKALVGYNGGPRFAKMDNPPNMDYADQVGENDVVFESNDAKVIVDRDALTYLDGTVVDFRREGLSESFKFDNPNVSATCGCGESFSIEKIAGTLA